jgi:aspartyl-tRNA(Asn)/glutamyl-tRNA(Gln) amidotransferase subunit A
MTAQSVRRLEAAGMVVLGKTQTVEFAFGGWGTNPSMGTPRNPWDGEKHRIPGGSSSGSAVAVAAGLAPAALGSDTGGSIRIPAGLCGVFGLKTSLGLVGRSGVLPLCPTHDTVGPLARSVRDVALLTQALAGPDPDDPSTIDAPHLDFLAEIERGIEGLRIAALDPADLSDLDPVIGALFERALQAIEDLGAHVSRLRLPRPLAEYMQLAGRLMSAESYRHLAPFADRDDSLVHPAIRERILRGGRISAADYMALLDVRREAQQEMLRCMDRIDALVAPTCPMPAIPVDEVDEDKTPLSAYGRFVNFLDLASLSIPIGTVPAGLPAGMQIVVRRFDDPLALRIGRALERDAGCAFHVPAGIGETTRLEPCGSLS